MRIDISRHINGGETKASFSFDHESEFEFEKVTRFILLLLDRDPDDAEMYQLLKRNPKEIRTPDGKGGYIVTYE